MLIIFKLIILFLFCIISQSTTLLQLQTFLFLSLLLDVNKWPDSVAPRPLPCLTDKDHGKKKKKQKDNCLYLFGKALHPPPPPQ